MSLSLGQKVGGGRNSLSLVLTFVFSLLLTAVVGIIVARQSPTGVSALPIPTITWLGGTDSNWNTAANWDTGLVPIASDDVLIPSANVTLSIPSSTNLTINSLTLTGATVLTISSVNTGTLQGGGPIVTKLITTADIYLEDTSQITSPTNTAATVTPNTINLDIGGLLSIVSGASINVNGKGFAGTAALNANPSNSGANTGACSGTNGAIGGQYGGHGGLQGGCVVSDPYGNSLAPTDLGSGGRARYTTGNSSAVGAGGGVIRVNAGSITLGGSIVSNGNDASATFAASGAGGSIYITAAQISGAGNLTANGGSAGGSCSGTFNCGPGSGGRISVVTTGTNSLTTSQYQAVSGSRSAGGYAGAIAGAAGTIYVKNSSTTYGNLTISNTNRTAADSSARTSLGISSPYQFDDLTITNGGRINLTGNLEVASYNFQGDYSILNLSGSFSYTSSDDFILNTNNFSLTVGSFVNTNTNLIMQNTTDNIIVINSSQQLASIYIDSNTSTITINGDLDVQDDIILSGNSSNNNITITGTTTATNLIISGTSSTNTLNTYLDITDDITLTDGTTTVCSVTATTSGAGSGLITSLNTVNISATNLTLNGVATLTHCTNAATTTNLRTLNIDLSDDLSIASGATIDATGKGYAGTVALNANPSNSGANTGACNGATGAAVGGQYGGHGGVQGGCTISDPYGDFLAPVDLGSGGRTRYTASNGNASGAGGGAIRINADSVALSGSIVSNGAAASATFAASGAGGSIYITATQISGSGILTANGGNAANQCSGTFNCGPGSGGRISVITTGVNSLINSQYQAVSGSRSAGGYGGALAGAAGTIFFRGSSSTYGTLIIDNANHSAADSTALTGTTPAALYQYDELVIIQGGRLSLTGNLYFTTYDLRGNYAALTLSGSLTYPTSDDFILNTNYFYLTIGSFANTNTNFIMQNTIGNVIVINSSQQMFSMNIASSTSTTTVNGNLDIQDDIVISGNSSSNTMTVTGVATATNLIISGTSSTNTLNAYLDITDDIDLTDGTTTICSITSTTSGSGAGLTTSLNTVNVSATNLTLNGTAILTHCTNAATATNLRTLNINLASDLLIASSATIDATGKGYAGTVALNANPSNSGANTGACNGTNGAIGGQYGGTGGLQGGCTTSDPYGNFLAPTDLGSGGRTRYTTGNTNAIGAGGGAIRVNADSITLNGSIVSNGGNASATFAASGAGGSIYITAAQISGAGNLIANGGSAGSSCSSTFNCGPGSGGRIASITTGVNSLATSQYQAASGSRSAGGYGGSLAGAAGTVFFHDSSSTYGTFIVDNANHSAADSTALTSTVPAALYQYDELVIIQGGRLALNGDLEFTTYDFRGDYASLNVSGFLDYTTSDDFILNTNYFYLTIGSFANTDTNLIMQNTTGNFVTINSSQQIFSMNITSGTSSAYSLIVNGNLDVQDGINLSGAPLNSVITISDTITATNLTISGTSSTNTLNAYLDIADDITITDGTTTVCSITSTTTGSGAGLTTTLNTVNVSATNLTLNGTAVLTHCTNAATATSLRTLNIDLSNSLSISSGASIDTTGKGYAGVATINSNPGNSGANIAACTQYGAVGGQYGGQGAIQGSCTASATYGELMTPTDLGSGGRHYYTTGNTGQATGGGGAIHIAADSITVNGSIASNGGTGTNNQAGAGGGGSIYIVTNQLIGTGNITANGGNTTSGGSGTLAPGGGGRIAIYTSGIYITNIVANHGPFIGGNTVTITGGGFTSGTRFYFDGNLATNINVQNNTTATMTVPAGAMPGYVDVKTVNFDGTITANRGTRANSGGTTAQDGTIYMPDGVALLGYKYDDLPISMSLDDICSVGLEISITPSPDGAISNGACTATITSGYLGYSLSLALDDSSWDIAYPLVAIGDGSTTGTLVNPIALTPGTIGFAVPKTQTNSAGLITSGFDASYPIVSSVPTISHTNKYAAIPEEASPITIKQLFTMQTDNETTFIVGANADLTTLPANFSFTIIITAVGN
ncbi:hypothetical protein FWF89_01100 [Candidatus Saccharibacteria bacterium]|nr:hypothetical protein [Candidatus Saccharibacteria bacterium]